MAYYCLHKFHWTPSQFDALSTREKAFVIASVQIKIKNEEEERKKLKSQKKR